MPREISLIFPGQGSQHLGMLSEELTHSHIDIINKSSDLLNFDIKSIINSDSDETLNKTSYTQPALLLTSYLYFLTFKKLSNIKPILMAGHSLGEYSALVAADAIDFYDALKLVHRRGVLMEEAPNGLMAAIIGLDASVLHDICEEVSSQNNIVSCANLNSPMQTVIAGTDSAVSKVCDIAKEKGAKRSIKLNVSVASHCLLMQKPAEIFNEFLEQISIAKPSINVIQNYSGEISEDELTIKSNLIQQLTGSVKWSHTMSKLKESNSLVIECGPGKVLSGIAKSNEINDILFMSSSNFKSQFEELV
ncbi:ACP S-malonyltransferase [Gammaproteobacteria bacterium]|nr:ACP S-malonyltransferase [Gammaproteobacteria bacterium]